MKVHALEQSLVLNPQETHPGGNPPGLGKQDTQHVGLSHLVLSSRKPQGLCIFLHNSAKESLSLLQELFVGKGGFHLLEATQKGLRIGDNHGLLVCRISLELGLECSARVKGRHKSGP